MPSATRRDAVCTFVGKNSPNVNNKQVTSQANKMFVRYFDAAEAGANHHYASLMIYPAPVPPNVWVQSATLTLTVTQAPVSTASARTYAFTITSPWDVNSVTYTNRPSIDEAGGRSTGLSSNFAVGRKIVIDVTNHVQGWSNGIPNYGWYLTTSHPQGFAVGISGSSAPTLTYTYATNPAKPVQMAPGSGSEELFVATPEPDLSVYSDIYQRGVIDAVQVQLSTSEDVTPTGSLASPVWTSPIQTSSIGTFSLANASGNPIPNEGEGYWWIGRVRSPSGLWSPWSNPIRWMYKPFPTLTISSPSGNADDISPTVAWSVSGGTQTDYRVTVHPNTGLATSPDVVWTSGLKSGDEGFIQIGKNLTVLKNYRVVVTISDEYRRIASSSDGVTYGTGPSAESDFTVVLSPSVAPPTNLRVASDHDHLPYIHLLFDRDSAPDSFQLIRKPKGFGDTEEVITVPPEHYSGNTYQYKVFNVEPGLENEWEIRAVINGSASSGNPSLTYTNNSKLLWLSDIDDEIYIPISGEAPTTVTYTETGETHDVANSPYKVRITSALQARSGRVSGHILGLNMRDGSTTTEDLRRKVLLLRETVADRILHLSIHGASCPVYVYNMSLGPVYGAPYTHMMEISFDWHEVGYA